MEERIGFGKDIFCCIPGINVGWVIIVGMTTCGAVLGLEEEWERSVVGRRNGSGRDVEGSLVGKGKV